MCWRTKKSPAEAGLSKRKRKLELFGVADGVETESFARADALDAGSFAAEVAEIIELGTADIAEHDDFDLGDLGAVNGESTLNADAVRDFANGECFTNATAAATNHGTLVNLDTFFVAFANFCVNANTVTDAEIRAVGLNLGLCKRID